MEINIRENRSGNQ